MALRFNTITLALGDRRAIVEGCREIQVQELQHKLQVLERWKARQLNPTVGRCPNRSCKQAAAKLAEFQAAARLPAASSRHGADGKLRARNAELERQVLELHHGAEVSKHSRACADKAAAQAAAAAAATQAAAKRKLAAVQAAAGEQVAAAEVAAAQQKEVASRAAAQAATAAAQAATARGDLVAMEKLLAEAEAEMEEAHADAKASQAAAQAAEARAVEREERSRVRELEKLLQESLDECAELREEVRTVRAESKQDARELERLKARSKQLTSLNMSAVKTGQTYKVYNPLPRHHLAPYLPSPSLSPLLYPTLADEAEGAGGHHQHSGRDGATLE